MTMRADILALMLAFAFSGCTKQTATLPYYEDESLTPLWPHLEKTSLPAFHQISEFNLIDQSGEPFTADSLNGRVHVASFFFATCTDICPKTRRQLKEIARAFAN